MVILNRRHDAFALLDCLAALTLLAGGIFMAVVFFRTEVREVRNMQERSVALLLAQSEVEKLYTGTYEAIPLGVDQPITLTLPSAQHVKGIKGYLTVVEAETGLKRATVRIAWLSPKDRLMHVELSSTFSEEGLGG